MLTNYLSLAGGEGVGVKLEHVEVVRLRYGKAVVDLPPPGPFAFATLIEAQFSPFCRTSDLGFYIIL